LAPLPFKGLIFRAHQYYHRQWLSNTEWSCSRTWAWARNRWLLGERLWEKGGFWDKGVKENEGCCSLLAAGSPTQFML